MTKIMNKQKVMDKQKIMTKQKVMDDIDYKQTKILNNQKEKNDTFCIIKRFFE